MRAFFHRAELERFNWGREEAKLLGLCRRLLPGWHIRLRKPSGVEGRKG